MRSTRPTAIGQGPQAGQTPRVRISRCFLSSLGPGSGLSRGRPVWAAPSPASWDIKASKALGGRVPPHPCLHLSRSLQPQDKSQNRVVQASGPRGLALQGPLVGVPASHFLPFLPTLFHFLPSTYHPQTGFLLICFIVCSPHHHQLECSLRPPGVFSQPSTAPGTRPGRHWVCSIGRE